MSALVKLLRRMRKSGFAEQAPSSTGATTKPHSPAGKAHERSGSPCVPQPPSHVGEELTSSVFIFNPFAEAHSRHGMGFTPTKHQSMLAEDLANLPQFLCQPNDIVLLTKRPSPKFLDGLKRAGFALPEFIEFRNGRVDRESFRGRRLGGLRPWAWGPDALKLFEPLLAGRSGEAGTARYFNEHTARLYSKAWSADFLRDILRRCRETHGPGATAERWLCSAEEAGVAVDTLEEALQAIAAIRSRGHHRLVVKEARGLAGHNAIRLWESELLPAQRRWLARVLSKGQQLVVEPWLERALDFSVQLEMGSRDLALCGYTGLVNDHRGQFLANWAEPNHSHSPPAEAARLFSSVGDRRRQIQRLFEQIFSALEAQLRQAGFVGPVSIDSFVYRTGAGEHRLKPVVEINPRYTMGRLTLELMKHTVPERHGVFRLVSLGQARADGFPSFRGYAHSLGKRAPLRLKGERIRSGAFCLNDPAQAQVCLATFEVGGTQLALGKAAPH